MRKAAVVIPAYNAERTIGELISRIKSFIPAEDIFVVDDGSTDRTGSVASELGAWTLKHSKKKGKGAALRDGVRKALELNYEMIVTLDSDLQHDPGEIPSFLEAAARLDVVVGKRQISAKTMPIHRVISNTLTSRMISSRTGASIEDSQCGYRLYKSNVLRSVDSKFNHFDYESDMLLKAALNGYRIGFIPIRTIYNDSRSNMRVVDILRFVRVYLKSFSILNDKDRSSR